MAENERVAKRPRTDNVIAIGWSTLPREIQDIILYFAWTPRMHEVLMVLNKYISGFVLSDGHIIRRYALRIYGNVCSPCVYIPCFNVLERLLKLEVQLGELPECMSRLLGLSGLSTNLYRHIVYSIAQMAKPKLGIIGTEPLDRHEVHYYYMISRVGHVGHQAVGYSELIQRLIRKGDVFRPYPGWRLLSITTQAWSSKDILVGEYCPEEYQVDVLSTLEKLSSQPYRPEDTLNTLLAKLKAVWYALPLAKDLTIRMLQNALNGSNNSDLHKTVLNDDKMPPELSWCLLERLDMDSMPLATKIVERLVARKTQPGKYIIQWLSSLVVRSSGVVSRPRSEHEQRCYTLSKQFCDGVGIELCRLWGITPHYGLAN